MTGLKFNFDVKTFEKEMDSDLQKIVVKADAVVSAEMQKAVQTAVGLVPTDEGFLKGSIESVKVAPLNYEFVAGAFYAPFMEFGTGKKVKIPNGYSDLARESGQAAKASAGAKGNFEQRIEEWIKRKGIKPKEKATGKGSRAANDSAMKNLIFLIKMEILKNGVKPHPFFIPAFEKFKSQVQTKLDKL